MPRPTTLLSLLILALADARKPPKLPQASAQPRDNQTSAPQPPLGVNANATLLQALCPRRNFARCFATSLQQKYPYVPLWRQRRPGVSWQTPLPNTLTMLPHCHRTNATDAPTTSSFSFAGSALDPDAPSRPKEYVPDEMRAAPREGELGRHAVRMHHSFGFETVKRNNLHYLDEDVVIFTGSGATGAINKLVDCLSIRIPADLDGALQLGALTSTTGSGGEPQLPFAVDSALLHEAAGELRAVRACRAVQRASVPDVHSTERAVRLCAGGGSPT